MKPEIRPLGMEFRWVPGVDYGGLLGASALSRVGTHRKRARVARAIGRTEHQVACGLEVALWEAGPNPVTDFADALQFEGKPELPSDKQEEWEGLGTFRDHLTKFMEGKNIAFIDGVAVRSYGGRTKATVDFDILVESKLLQGTTKFLEGQGGTLMGSSENTYHFNLKGLVLDLDVRVAKSPLDEAALAGAKLATFQGRKLKIVLAKALTAMKVKAYSERKHEPQGLIDRDDVRGLLKVGAATEHEVRQILKKYRPDLLSELDEILST
ncbi:MAG TPA: hypothetical protein VMU54_03060 [Planctomycetota bacterium]|nr:hypothetical protein [Planctomycetota bacterium]